MDGDGRSILLGWLAFHRNALGAKCDGLNAQELAGRSVLPSPLLLLALVGHLTEMEHVYAVWALGPQSDLTVVWGEYTDGGPDWDIDASEVKESLQAWKHERARADEPIAGHTSLDDTCEGNRRSVRWNLTTLIGEDSRHNGHADLIRERALTARRRASCQLDRNGSFACDVAGTGPPTGRGRCLDKRPATNPSDD